MRGVRVSEHGGLEKLVVTELPDPVLGPSEVAVAVHVAALNHLDVWVRRGVPGHEFPLPLVPASDGAGTIAAVGPGVTDVEIGQRVLCCPGVSCGHCRECLAGRDQCCREYAILGEARDGCLAECVVVPRNAILAIPDDMSFETAAAFPLSFLTAWTMLIRRARLAPGETILVQAALSGVGSAAVQIAKLVGARVLATAGSPAKRERALALGAEACFDYSDVVAGVKQATGGRGVEVVADHVGAASFASSMRSLARSGRYVTCGATTGPKVELMLNHVFFKNLSILGSTMGSRGDLPTLLDLVARGRLEPVIGAVLSGLESVVEGHRLLESREAVGKVVIRVRE